MRQFAKLLILLVVFSSCSKDNEKDQESIYSAMWYLTKISGSMPNSEITGDDIQRKEYYQFKENGTFTKYRIENGITKTAFGTFITKIELNRTYMELAYSQESDIVGSCYGNQKEELYFSDDKKILSSTWRNCDGPGLDYKQETFYCCPQPSAQKP